jgi:L-2-hydroxycarboxylate dehydrogenase (NAD+)
MNRPPTEAIRVAPEAMRSFVSAVFVQVGLSEEDAGLLAQLLVLNDLRGVFSHGTRQVSAYVDHFRHGRLNPRPQVQVISDMGTTVVVDGDGGLGYFPAWRAAHLVAEKCREHGIAAAVTRQHGHIGAAGLYSRVPMTQNQIGYCTSGHQLDLREEQSVLSAAGGSPMSFAIPAGAEPPLVLDFGATQDLYPGSAHLQELIRLAPGLVFRNAGLGSVCQAVGGFLAGVPLGGEATSSAGLASAGASPGGGGRPADTAPPETARRWPGANQGAFLVAVEIGRFLPVETFIAQMERYARQVRQMQPVPGHEPATLAGGPEWQREREWAQSGIPVSEQHRRALQKVGELLGVPPPL